MKKPLTTYYLSRFSFIKSRFLDSAKAESGLYTLYFKLYTRHKTFVLKRNEGFVALISAIIIAAVLLIFVVGAGAGGFFTRFDVFGTEIKEVSYGLAEACVHTAILKASQNPDEPISNDTVPVGDEECEIVSYTPATDEIEARGVYQNSFTNLRVTIDDTDFTVDSWEECPDFSACTI